jgi:tetratricopeptide (TPR) repeat protein
MTRTSCHGTLPRLTRPQLPTLEVRLSRNMQEPQPANPRRSLALAPLAACLLLSPAPVASALQAAIPPRGVAAPSTGAANPSSLSIDPSQVEAGIERHLVEKLEARYEKMLRDAKERDDQIREQLTVILDATAGGLAAAGLLFAVLAVFGFRGISQLRNERKKAIKERKKVKRLKRDIDRIILAHVKASIERAWSGLETQFHSLPEIGDQQRLSGSARLPIAAEEKQAYEETDLLLVLGDKLDALGSAEKATTYFNRLATFWWASGDWARATARSRRALEISPTSFAALVVYAKGQMDRSSRLPAAETRTKLLLLAEAERLLTRARLLKPEESAQLNHKLGWISDERGDFPRAAELYRRALSEQLTPEVRARYGYDLACTLCRDGQLQEALEVLEPIINLDDNRRLAAIDPDFEPLRQSALHKVQFAALVVSPNSP